MGARATPELVRALEDENAVVRRTAVRLLADMGEPALKSLEAALDNSDLPVRRAALTAICLLTGRKALPYMAEALKDPNTLMRMTAVKHLLALKPRTKEIIDVLRTARNDKDESVRNAVAAALFPFYKEPFSVRDRTDWDHDIKIIRTIRLPKTGWRFKPDPRRIGHAENWFDPDYDDSDWKPIRIEQAWQKAGYDYTGVAWYRRTFTLPPKPSKHLAVEIRFLGVDESAWVWINGRYVGQHDIGPAGWDMPFTLDITSELKWGRQNHIAVRAMNTRAAGGIWRPVQIEILQ